MSYQNIGTPRFYINVLEWLDATGYITTLNNRERTLPVKPAVLPSSTDFIEYNISSPAFKHNPFFAVLGHSGFTGGAYIKFTAWAGSSDTSLIPTNIVNTEVAAQHSFTAPYNGFSIGEFGTDTIGDSDSITISNNSGVGSLFAGSIILGTYYDMPHSPDLSLTMETEYGGIKTIETKGGASLSNTFYTKPPAWGLIEAWGLYSGETGYISTGRSGRRTWSLSFSYLQDSDVFPEISSYEPYESTSSSGELYSSGDDWHLGNTMLDSDTFFSAIHKLNGGQLPFIFQPDNSNNNPDQFAICKFDMKSFKFTQVAHKLYNVRLKIREVW